MYRSKYLHSDMVGKFCIPSERLQLTDILIYANYLCETLCWENKWSNNSSCGHLGVNVLNIGSQLLELHDLTCKMLFICPSRCLKCTPCIYYHDTCLSYPPHILRNTLLIQIQRILKNEFMVWSSLSDSRNTIESLSIANTHHKITHIKQINKQDRVSWQVEAKSLQHSDSVLCLVSELLKNFLEYHQGCLIRMHFPCQSIP